MFIGELIALFVAVSWTATALFAEVGSKHMGSLPFNTIRMTMSLVFLCITLWLVMGVPYPRYADTSTWTWLLLSGLVGFFLAVVLFNKDGLDQLRHALSDRKAMLCVLASTIFGPFIGVSASLLATQFTSAGIAQTLFALTPILIIAPAALLFHQKVTLREVMGAVISVAGVCLFFA